MWFSFHFPYFKGLKKEVFALAILTQALDGYQNEVSKSIDVLKVSIPNTRRFLDEISISEEKPPGWKVNTGNRKTKKYLDPFVQQNYKHQSQLYKRTFWWNPRIITPVFFWTVHQSLIFLILVPHYKLIGGKAKDHQVRLKVSMWVQTIRIPIKTQGVNILLIDLFFYNSVTLLFPGLMKYVAK